MRIRHLRVWCGRILLASLLTILAGCDGGIFGTGDGGIDSSADTVDAGSPVQEPIDTSDTTSTDEVESSPDDSSVSNPVETRPFENLMIGSSNTQPLVALVNLSSVPLEVMVDGDELFPDAIPPGVVSDYASVALESTQLGVTDGDTAEQVLILSPLNLGAFTVSTLIARDRLTSDGNEQALSDVEIIAIASQQQPSDDGVARVRLLQASPIDDADEAASMSLVPAGDLPGESEVDLGVLSADSFGNSTEYRLVTAGSYDLVDSLGRLAPQAVELAVGEFHTLILTGSTVELLVLRDSQDVE